MELHQKNIEAVNQLGLEIAKLNSTMSSSIVENISAGLRVLVVDDNSTCLEILTKMLQKCGYNVTKCSSADVAVSLLEENKDGYDLLISEVHMPCMDGLKLLEHIQLKMDLPVIMVSADDSQDVVMKAVIGGACDYLIKPVHINILKNIWQHVVRKKMDGSSTANESKKMDKEDSSSQKKPRVIWSLDLHKKFMDAFNKLGPEKASPKKILALMNVPGLTRENVGSHLQKYRKYLEEEEEQQQQKMKGIM